MGATSRTVPMIQLGTENVVESGAWSEIGVFVGRA